MSQLVLYRKYRPQLFAEVINQKNIINTLSNALLQGQISHAYLFSGLRGIGKTTVARLLAKALNCQGRKSNQFEPCNKCESCKAIKAGNSLDLVEIDAASNRGIEDVRSLRENIKFPPVNSKYKIFIIDEEPPSYAVFILATTEPDKLPATILSRVERYDFKKLNLDDIIGCLKNICKQEKIKFEDEALRLIALYSEGGLRDAQSLLGQISLITDRNITKKAVEELVGAINFEKVKKFINYLAKKEKEKALEFINDLYDEGYDLEVFNKETLSYLRKILLLKISPTLGKILEKEATNEEISILFKQAQSFDTPYLEKLLKRFIEIQVQLRRTPILTLPFELCISEEL